MRAVDWNGGDAAQTAQSVVKAEVGGGETRQTCVGVCGVVKGEMETQVEVDGQRKEIAVPGLNRSVMLASHTHTHTQA